MRRLVSNIRRPFAIVPAVAGLMTLAPAVSRGSIIYYATRSAFDAAEPGLPVQGFSSANLYGQPFVILPNGLNSATNNSVFVAGSILPGLTISTLHPGSASNALEVYGLSIGNSWFGDTLVLSFAPGVSAVAEDAFANTSYGPSFAGNITEEIFNGSTTLGARTFSEAADGSVFIGVSSTTLPITSVELSWTSDGDASTFTSNIAFGTPASAAPEPSTFALLALGAALIGFRIAPSHPLGTALLRASPCRARMFGARRAYRV